jgi:hypothetical protein
LQAKSVGQTSRVSSEASRFEAVMAWMKVMARHKLSSHLRASHALCNYSLMIISKQIFSSKLNMCNKVSNTSLLLCKLLGIWLTKQKKKSHDLTTSDSRTSHRIRGVSVSLKIRNHGSTNQRVSKFQVWELTVISIGRSPSTIWAPISSAALRAARNWKPKVKSQTQSSSLINMPSLPCNSSTRG